MRRYHRVLGVSILSHFFPPRFLLVPLAFRRLRSGLELNSSGEETGGSRLGKRAKLIAAARAGAMSLRGLLGDASVDDGWRSPAVDVAVFEPS